MSHMEAANI